MIKEIKSYWEAIVAGMITAVYLILVARTTTAVILGILTFTVVSYLAQRNLRKHKDQVMKSIADLSKFKPKHFKDALKLIHYYSTQEPEYLGEGTRLMYNSARDMVFLIDDETNIAGIHDGKLEQWHQCEECAVEGFKEEVERQGHKVWADGSLIHKG